MSESVNDRTSTKMLFGNPTSRNLLAIWARVTGSRVPMQVVCDLLGATEDSVEGRLQTMAGLGLVHVLTEAQGLQSVEFLPCPNVELKKSIEEFLESRKSEFELLELKVRSFLYITMLNSPV